MSGVCDLLLVIDVQHVFTDRESPWGSPMYDAARPRVLERMSAYGDRVIATRYVAPTHPTGAWTSYFEEWPWALVPPNDPLYALVPEVAALVTGPIVDLPTFGKWGPQLAAAFATLGTVESVEVVGLATDCCVLSTVLAMADAGLAVTVDAAGCGGSTLDDHARALAVMELYAPLVTVVR